MNIFYLAALLFVLNLVYLQTIEASFLLKWFCKFAVNSSICRASSPPPLTNQSTQSGNETR
uniref:Secreted protein n=1 Tax=Schistosoma mansoni TaxID=6183 RepID=A0A5K4F9V9_SCHMA